MIGHDPLQGYGWVCPTKNKYEAQESAHVRGGGGIQS